MSFVAQRGCHFLSDSVLFGDPMFGKVSNQSVHIPNIEKGYWHIEANINKSANKDERVEIISRFSKYKTVDRMDLAGEYLSNSVSGYLGVFDERRFQAGWTNRCQ